MGPENYLTFKEAAERYGRSESTMSRLVRRLGLTVVPNPQDRRSKLIYQGDLDAALARALPPKGSRELRELMRAALERARLGRRELASSGRQFLGATDALSLVRGEGLDDRLR